jgi:hypothetical protein
VKPAATRTATRLEYHMTIRGSIFAALRMTGVLVLLWPLAALAHDDQDRRDGAANDISTRPMLIAQASDADKSAAAKQTAASDESGAVTILNCSGRAITVKAFNEDDTDLVVPTQTNAIAEGQALSLNCATSRCKLTIENIKTDPLSGPLVYTKGSVAASDKDTIDKGCSHVK